MNKMLFQIYLLISLLGCASGLQKEIKEYPRKEGAVFNLTLNQSEYEFMWGTGHGGSQIVFSKPNPKKKKYYFDFAFDGREFIKKIGDPESIKEITIRIRADHIQVDSNSSDPKGDFSRTYYCSIIKVLKIKFKVTLKK